MTPEAQRIAIAEACGWKRIERSESERGLLRGQHPTWMVKSSAVPAYLTDLNAMHEAEILLLGPDWDEEKWAIYKTRLHQTIEPHRHVINSTAAQRAKALLRTIGKWTDDK